MPRSVHLRQGRHLPEWFAAENANGSPVNSLWVTNGLIQFFLLLTFFSESAYQFFYFIASVAILLPYVFSGAYAPAHPRR